MDEHDERETTKRPRGTGSIYTKHGVVWISYHDRGKRYRESSGLGGKKGRTAAGNLLKQRLGSIHAGKFRPRAERVRLSDLKRLVLADYAINERRTAKRVEQCFAHLEEFFGHTPAVDVPRRASEYIAARLEEKAANATIRNEIRALARGFRLAVRDQLLADRPVFPTVRATNVRTGFVDDKTMVKVLAALPDYMRALAEFCYRTAWRRGMATGLRCSDDDFDSGVIRLPGSRTKSCKAAAFPFTRDPRLSDLLAERKAATDAWQRERGELIPFVFWRGTKRGAVRVRYCWKSWDKARKAAGLPDLLLHDLRRVTRSPVVRARRSRPRRHGTRQLVDPLRVPVPDREHRRHGTRPRAVRACREHGRAGTRTFTARE
jgi:integrase